MGFFSALVFGLVFSVGWTPCVGAFLGSALMLASQQGQALTGMMMLLAYSLGLGIPFVISALLIDYLKSAFDWIKRNYRRRSARHRAEVRDRNGKRRTGRSGQGQRAEKRREHRRP